MYLAMDVCTDQQAISQDYWPTEESFQSKEILKWRDIPDTGEVNLGIQLF